MIQNFMRVKKVWLGGGLLVIGAMLGVAADRVIADHIACRERNFALLNPELRCANSTGIDKREYVAFKAKLNELITKKKQQGQLTAAAVYFRDLNNGPHFGIDEKELFFPASLLKLPVLLAYLADAEDNDALLSQQITFKQTEPPATSAFFRPKEEIKEDRPYTIDELLSRMIIYSDNLASGVLSEYFGNEKIFAVFRDLGLVETDDLEFELSVKQYASIFRILYNASYLSKEMSNKALALLANADFPGMAGGVSDDVAVAHKFGERGFTNGVRQLHDCGIVYYPQNPYLLCIMTRGSDFTVLADIIREISAAVYREVDSRRIK